MAICHGELVHTSETRSSVLQEDTRPLGGSIELHSPYRYVFPLERLLLIQVHHMRQENSDIQSAFRLGAGHGAQDVEPGGQSIAGCFVEDRVTATSGKTKAHLRELDVNAAIQRNVLDLSLVGDCKPAHLEHHGHRVDGGVLELKAGSGSLLVLSQWRTDRLSLK